MSASIHSFKTYTRADIIEIARRAKNDPGSITFAELRVLAMFVQEVPDDDN